MSNVYFVMCWSLQFSGPLIYFGIFLLAILCIVSSVPVTNTDENDVSLDYMYDVLNDTEYQERSPADYGTFLVTGGFRSNELTFVRNTVSIRSRNPTKFFGDNHFCGGTIIASDVILTAAHCVVDKITDYTWVPTRKVMNVVAGTPVRLRQDPTTRVHKVKRFTVHPDYRSSDLSNDIAIVFLETPLEFDGKTIARIDYAQVTPPVGTECYVVGWGYVFVNGPLTNEVLYAKLYTWPMSRCKRFVRKQVWGKLCAHDDQDYEADACSGDSGGPLFCNGILTGIVSYGFQCALAGYPGIYTDVSYYKDWIARGSATKGVLSVSALSGLVAVLMAHL